MKRFFSILVFAAALLAAAPPAAQEFLALKSIGELHPPPDGATLVFTVSTPDFTTNKHVSKLMRMPANGGAPVPLQGVPSGASNVRWSPDGGRLAFFATREDKQALWVLMCPRGS